MVDDGGERLPVVAWGVSRGTCPAFGFSVSAFCLQSFWPDFSDAALVRPFLSGCITGEVVGVVTQGLNTCQRFATDFHEADFFIGNELIKLRSADADYFCRVFYVQKKRINLGDHFWLLQFNEAQSRSLMRASVVILLC
jgi:hypothetical protein